MAAWSVCRLGRSLPDLIGLLGELQARDIDLYLHQQALDTSTPSSRMLFGMLGVFSEFERAMIRDRVLAGLDRARSSGKRLGRPRTTPFRIDRIRAALDEGRGVRERARPEGVSRQSERGQADVVVGEVRSASLIGHAKPDDQAQFQGDTGEAAGRGDPPPLYPPAPLKRPAVDITALPENPELAIAMHFAETATERSTAELLWALPHLNGAMPRSGRQCGLVSEEIARRHKASGKSRGTKTPIMR